MTTIYEMRQRMAEKMSTENLKRDLARYERLLEETGRKADAYIAQEPERLAATISSLLADCRTFAMIIRVSSEELALRGAA